MNYSLFRAGALLMALAVVLGALGAHALERVLSSDILESFETGVRYHIYHSLALLILSAIYQKLPKQITSWAVRTIIAGMICFSGSIYIFAFGHIFDVRLAGYLWWVTPLGGLLLIAGWLILFFGVPSFWSPDKKSEQANYQ